MMATENIAELHGARPHVAQRPLRGPALGTHNTHTHNSVESDISSLLAGWGFATTGQDTTNLLVVVLVGLPRAVLLCLLPRALVWHLPELTMDVYRLSEAVLRPLCTTAPTTTTPHHRNPLWISQDSCLLDILTRIRG